jgi:hypothetical protein
VTVTASIVPRLTAAQLHAIDDWNGAQQRAREEHQRDPFAAARAETLSQLKSWRRAGRITYFDYIASLRDVRAWNQPETRTA